LEAWYADEVRGYASLGASEWGPGHYQYHALNSVHGFRYLPAGQIGSALGLGSAYADEFEPIVDRLSAITVLEPAVSLRAISVGGLRVRYIDPNASGIMPFDDDIFDLATSFGTLHHIPNVGTVIRELARVVRPGAYLLIREPIVSMGDWRRPRAGLTARERGVPPRLLRGFYQAAGLTLVKETYCMAVVTNVLNRHVYHRLYDSPVAVRGDALIARLLRPNYRYYATGVLRRLRPTSVFHVLMKPQLN
jgi:SAM-dependent methyltransferase